MTQGIPSRDLLVDRNGQITTIWLIFFQHLYSVYSDSSQNNADTLAQIKQIANQAIEMARQAKNDNEAQQKEIDALYDQITNASNNFATSQDIQTVNKRVEQTEYDIQQLQLALDKLKKTFVDSEKVSKDKFTDLQDQINNLARSSFVEAPVDGKTYGRKDLEWSEIMAVKLSLPFFLSDGTAQNIPLTSDFQLPFFLSDGTQQNIQMVTL
ncbi:DUF3450 domain-containing protein [Acinetobacter bereziniae]|uniref:DUF3450 domain-containing protein n=1 Tax=Acinetobacter bereziniae TaxID=106648 RepID=UPI00111775B2|nr:DUF3450 domain-containing protein [Acinetobacter bereziniae]TNL51199.1 hypothetical protein EYB59_08745 [Acinetobacter bereziniae]TNL58443.1 hypothetical protein EYY58_11570 [Acinetobacter bereziniae]